MGGLRGIDEGVDENDVEQEVVEGERTQKKRRGRERRKRRRLIERGRKLKNIYIYRDGCGRRGESDRDWETYRIMGMVVRGIRIEIYMRNGQESEKERGYDEMRE